MTKEHLQEAAIVDLPDDQLKEFLGFCYHSAKNLEERKKSDETIAELRQKLKDYTDSVYTQEIKSFKARLKAARAVAALRGISWNPPTLEQEK